MLSCVHHDATTPFPASSGGNGLFLAITTGELAPSVPPKAALHTAVAQCCAFRPTERPSAQAALQLLDALPPAPFV